MDAGLEKSKPEGEKTGLSVEHGLKGGWARPEKIGGGLEGGSWESVGDNPQVAESNREGRGWSGPRELPKSR